MITKKIISTLLAVLMLASTFSLLVGAAEGESTFQPEYDTMVNTPTINYLQGRVEFDNAGSKQITTAKEKIATMDCRLEKDGYRLYVDAYSGEVGVECIATGEILLSNPYDLGTSSMTSGQKMEMMSQIVVNFKDITKDQTQVYYSATYSAGKAYDKNGNALSTDTKSDAPLVEPSQIRVRNIKNGLRVEYTIGPEQTKMLVPRVIEKESFETRILNPIKEAIEAKKAEWLEQYLADGYDEKSAADRVEQQVSLKLGPIVNFYKLYDPSAVDASVAEQYYASLPITKKMAVYAIDATLSTKIRARVEQIIKEFAPHYTFEMMDEDHQKTEYVDKDQTPPLFKMALEYTLDEQGLSVRLPANGIRYTESLYELLSVEILPYMGAVSNEHKGYSFFPDGSGALFDFQQIADGGADVSVVNKVYGQDFAYHTITGAHQEPIRYPVFGITSTEEYKVLDENGNPVVEAIVDGKTVYQTYEQQQGFVAIVEEGDAMMELIADHAMTTTKYNSVKMRVYPRPRDTYNVADAIAGAENKPWSVVSSRKYTGSYKIRYMLLTSDEVAKEKNLTNTFDTTYVGMALAYRSYLEKTGVLTKLTAADVKENIPLYIETFGAMQTTERFLSIPYETMTPLTTFADINTMYDDLAAEDVTNVNFILTGYTKGGLTNPKVPYHLKWDKAVESGDMNFSELTEVAKEKGFGIFPDFDFAFVKQDAMFDGLSLRKHAVKTIDDRYTSKREYSATKQTYISYFELALSPAYFNRFYTKLTENFLEYDPIGISVSTLGMYLNSDFDEDEPYNRADAEQFTVEAFAYLRENYNKVMTAGGNAYTWKYVDYITDVALDSSRYSAAAASVPFLGIVLHGYVEFAGTPINMEGNTDYAILKALESGAGLQFILSYRNTDNLKEDEVLSKYYSIRYNIWKDDMISMYNEVNDLLKGVQTSAIVGHEFIEGVRVPDNDELEADAAALLQALIEKEAAALEQSKTEKNYRILMARKLLTNDVNGGAAAILKMAEEIQNVTDENGTQTVLKTDTDIGKAANKVNTYLTRVDVVLKLAKAQAEYDKQDQILKTLTPGTEAFNAQKLIADAAYEALTAANKAVSDAKAGTDALAELNGLYSAMTAYLDLARVKTDNYRIAEEGYAILEAKGDYTSEQLAAMAENLHNDGVVKANELLCEQEDDLLNKVYAAYKAYKAVYTNDEASAYNYAPTTTDEAAEETVVEENKYASDANKIAYVRYENGTAFILNFNNYAVVVTNPYTNITYTVEAYGYVFLKPNA